MPGFSSLMPGFSSLMPGFSCAFHTWRAWYFFSRDLTYIMECVQDHSRL